MRLTFFFILLGPPVFAWAQEDTIPAVKDSMIRQIRYDPQWLQQADTSIIPLQEKNPQRYLVSQLHFDWIANPGNIGGPAYPLFQTASEFDPLRISKDPMSIYYAHFEGPGRITTSLPYTLLKFNTGPGKEQNLNVSHHQHVATRWDFGLDYRLISSPGNYQHQARQLHNLNLNLNYHSLDGRYESLLSFMHHKYTSDQNGGIADDTLFLENEEEDPGVIPVNLLNASSINRNTGLNLHHSFRLIGNDSIAEKGSQWLPSILSHNLNYSRSFRTFFEPDPLNDFYPAVLKDSSETNDSLGLGRLDNTVFLSNRKSLIHAGIRYGFGFRHSMADYFNGSETSRYSQLTAIARAEMKTSDRFRASLAYQHIIPLESGEGFSFHLSLEKNTGHDSLNTWWISLLHQARLPELFILSYVGNHFSWENDPEVMTESMLKAGASLHGFRLEGQLLNRRNAIFFNHAALPVQYDNDLPSFAVAGSKEFRFGVFRNYTKVAWQSVSRQLLQGVPEFLASTTLQADINPFRGDFNIRLGTDLTYLSSYYGMYYHPVTNQFYIQDDFQQGNHLFADAYLILIIRRATIFFKFRDISNSLLGEGYYLTPGYPQAYGGFNFGVNWTFFD